MDNGHLHYDEKTLMAKMVLWMEKLIPISYKGPLGCSTEGWILATLKTNKLLKDVGNN
jgi:hypothetical protein